MERQRIRIHGQLLLCAAAALVGAYLLRRVLWALLAQMTAAAVLMLLALPLCRLLERRWSPSLSAVLSLGALAAAVIAAVLLLVPPVARQFRQLTEALPAVIAWCQKRLMLAQSWLAERDISLIPARDELFGQLGGKVGGWVTSLAGMVGHAAQGVGQLLLSPLLAFYLLRDRRRIASGLTLTIPVKYRARAVRAAREMRRETAGFLRGQLILSLVVGGLTAVALLVVGTPGWLLLGVFMGVMEMVPYIGPFIAGVPAVLLAMQGGLARALWTLGAIMLVQQLEGTFLSPRLLSGATRLHPLAVLLAISAGGMLGGAIGMVAVIPAMVSVRGALRGWRR
ncbi:MAG: AI-2E family transporter [Christensenellaceae bacterium]|nr:AI-2E family transporter [Christensenellaceae bacterium]